MKCTEERDGGVVTAALEGRIDAGSAPAAHAAVLSLVKATDRALVIDLEGVPYLSSAGLRSALIIARRMGERSVPVVFCHLSEKVASVFAESGFDRILTVVADREAASAAVSHLREDAAPGGTAEVHSSMSAPSPLARFTRSFAFRKPRPEIETN